MLQRLANLVLGAVIFTLAGSMLLSHLTSGEPAQALVLLLSGALMTAAAACFRAGLIASTHSVQHGSCAARSRRRSSLAPARTEAHRPLALSWPQRAVVSRTLEAVTCRHPGGYEATCGLVAPPSAPADREHGQKVIPSSCSVHRRGNNVSAIAAVCPPCSGLGSPLDSPSCRSGLFHAATATHFPGLFCDCNPRTISSGNRPHQRAAA